MDFLTHQKKKVTGLSKKKKDENIHLSKIKQKKNRHTPLNTQ
jgi:hypothetical protein